MNGLQEAALYSMKLHEHDKYNGSLKARKSFFAFENRIVCIGDGLENSLPGSQLHTTLFQNSIDQNCDSKTEILEDERIILRDRFSNAYFVSNGQVCLSEGLQNSYHEETDAPTQGYFEKAYINHGAVCSAEEKDRYEYMVVIAPSEQQLGLYEKESPYQVLRADSEAHIVKDMTTGITGCAAFKETTVDENIHSISPSILLYSRSGDSIRISVSNPDLALYVGEADEILDENGKRKERSVYGRSWVNAPAHPTTISIKVNGKWNASGVSDMNVNYEDDKTVITINTIESRTEEITLNKQ